MTNTATAPNANHYVGMPLRVRVSGKWELGYVTRVWTNGRYVSVNVLGVGAAFVRDVTSTDNKTVEE